MTMLPLSAEEENQIIAARLAAEARIGELWDDVDPEWEARRTAIRQRWDYYEGRHPRPLVVEDGEPDDNTILNLARPIVDRGVAFLAGAMPRMQLDETADADTALEQTIRSAWDLSGGASLIQELAQNGGISGASVAKITTTAGGAVPWRVVNLDPSTVRMAYGRGDVSDILGYRIQFEEDGTHYREDITRDGPPGSYWTITAWEGRVEVPGLPPVWRMVGEPVPWPYPLPPIVWCKNFTRANVAWGYSDLEDAQLNNAVNGVVTSARKTLRMFADPQTFLSGMSGEGLRRGGDNIWYSEDPDADAKNLEMQSDLASARNFYMDLRAAAMMIAAVPDVAMIGDKLGSVTNFGLRVLYATMLERNEVKRALYGGLIQRVNAVIAMLATGERQTAIRTTLTWADPLPRNELEHIQTIQAKQATGLVSEETLTAELGYSYADERDRLAAERAEREARAAVAATPAGAGGNGMSMQGADLMRPGQGGMVAATRGMSINGRG